ncbi:MAG: hypothetical protein K1W05_06805 [Desulfovibrio sp.]
MDKVGKALLVAIWFMVLTLPVMGIKLNLLENRILWRFDRLLWLGLGTFFLALCGTGHFRARPAACQ